MNYTIFVELRRRAEKRLIVLKAGPLLTFQLLFYGLMVVRAQDDLGIPTLATLMSFCIVAAMWFLYRARTAANRRVRRTAIDRTLEDSIEMGWPLENPSPRQLRLLAGLLDDDLETRAEFGRSLIALSVMAAIGWVLTLWQTSYMAIYDLQGYGLEFLALWLVAFGGLMLLSKRPRKAAEQRVRAALEGAGAWDVNKKKRPTEAPWWRDDADEATEKPKHESWANEADGVLGDDGEFNDGYAEHQQRLT
ncbi:MAG: hypothetical protein U0452_06430 [Anaerolineae bacterium]